MERSRDRRDSVPQLEEEERGRLGCVLQWRWLEVVRGAAARLSSIYREQRQFAREKNLGGALCSTTAAQSVHGFDARQDDTTHGEAPFQR